MTYNSIWAGAVSPKGLRSKMGINRPTDRAIKWGVESCSTRLNISRIFFCSGGGGAPPVFPKITMKAKCFLFQCNLTTWFPHRSSFLIARNILRYVFILRARNSVTCYISQLVNLLAFLAVTNDFCITTAQIVKSAFLISAPTYPTLVAVYPALLY